MTLMHNFSTILSSLQAAIAVVAARDRRLTVLLVAMWGRIARMGRRLERLVAMWRAGTLPQARARARSPRARPATTAKTRPSYPTAPDWLLRALGHHAVAAGLQLRHLLSEEECVAFLAAVPQAGRILRPLLRMLSGDPLPEMLRNKSVAPVAPVVTQGAELAGVVVLPVSHFLGP